MEGTGETSEQEPFKNTSAEEIWSLTSQDQNTSQPTEREELAVSRNESPANVGDDLEDRDKIEVSSLPTSLQEKAIEPTEDNSLEDFNITSLSTKSSPIGEEDSREKLPSEGENSPPSNDDSLGRRKRKPSRYHDSMFDIPTNLMNINRTINPEEFRAFHSKSAKQKEKSKKVLISSDSPKQKTVKSDLKGISEKSSPPVVEENLSTSTLPEARAHEDDVLDTNNLFKFKMRKDHVIQNLSGGPTAYKCDICMMTFPRSFSLRRHYTRRHINPRYVVPKSGATAPAATDVQHGPPDFDSAENKYLYACKMCSKDLLYFRHKNYLRVHCHEMHNSEPRRPVSVFKCELCKRSYTTRHELERHKRTHSGERPYACAFCHKTFPTSTNARRHERTHTGDRPHICKVCNKGFIQRTDMVKHLRSIHKMKVTKTKAERADNRKPGFEHDMGLPRPADSKEGDYEVDSSNEFQENIDFAAYLKLDQHDSGTLMGEKALQRGALGPFLGKEKQINNNNNVVTGGPNVSNNLKHLQPSEIMGEDGRPEKCHRCPDCSKMFSSNINLRRHHKLKHERNQLYQHAEPVSMVVEKYKIKDEAAGAIFEPNRAITEENEKPEENIDSQSSPSSMLDNSTLKSKILAADETFSADVTDENGVLSGSHDDQAVQKIEVNATVQPSTATRKPKASRLSKLSSIVQRLADKRSAEHPPSESKGPEGKFDGKQPIAKLEEMGSQLFGQSFPSDSLSMSPKRKKRKPVSVQQVKSSDLSQETKLIASDSKPRLMPEKSHTKSHINRHGDGQRNFPRLSGEEEGIFRNVFRSSPKRPPSVQMQTPPYGNDLAKIPDRFHGSSPFSYHHNDFRPRGPMTPEHRVSSINDISKSFHSLSQEPFPLAKMPPNLPEHGQMIDTSRMESFLSQCWSSRKRDIPQNAILDRNMPSRDAYDMTMKLKYNMRHLSDEKSNEHLPPAAYFSRRDNVSLPQPPDVPGVFQKDEPQRNLPEGAFQDNNGEGQSDVKSDISPLDGDSTTNAPLDLRVPSKKVKRDYIVRDDGVLDFSQKSRNSLKRPASNVSNLDAKVKIEAGHRRNEAMFSDRSPPPLPIPIPNMDKVPPWLRPSHQDFWNKQATHIKTPLHPPMPEHRRDIIHGRHPRPSKKPFKFHSMDFKPPHLGYGAMDSRKSYPPHTMPLYRGSPFSSRNIRHSGSPSSSQRHSPSMNMPMWPDPKDEKPILYSGNKLLLSQHGHQHFPSAPPCTICSPGPLPVPHIPDHRDAKSKLPHRSNYKNWPFGPRHDYFAKGRIPPLRPILPKTGLKDDIFKSRSPFDRDPILDEDMMNRCIIKAQQALKTKSPQDATKRSIHPHDSSLVRPGAPQQSYMQKPLARSAARPISSKPIIPSSARAPVKPAVKEETANPQQSALKLPYEPPSKKPKNSDLVSTNIADTNEEPLSLTKPKELDDAKTTSFVEEVRAVQRSMITGRVEDVEEERAEREKLTMTPGLDSSQDDESEKLINTRSDDVTKVTYYTGNADKEVGKLLTNNEFGSKSSSQKLSSLFVGDANILKKDEQPVRPKSCDNAIGNTRYSFVNANRSASPSSDISCSKSASPVSYSTSPASKLSERRHTYASSGRRKTHTKNETLKRSSSSDSPQCDTDESDGTPKKLIKKLKLRVVKSPGSEKKKYWTLVEQDAPKAADGESQEPPERDSLQHPPMKDDQGFETEDDALKRTHVGISKTDEKMLPDEREENRSNQETFEDIQIPTPQTIVKAVDKCETRPILEKLAAESGQVDITETDFSLEQNVLTDSHVENALTAITMEPHSPVRETTSTVGNTHNFDTIQHCDDLSSKDGSLCDIDEGLTTSSEIVQEPLDQQLNFLVKSADETQECLSAEEGTTPPRDTDDGEFFQQQDTVIHSSKNHSTPDTTALKKVFDPHPSVGINESFGKNDDLEVIPSPEKPTKPRTTRSNTAVAAVSQKAVTEKKQVITSAKKTEPPIATASPTSSRLRRSVRIRKTSSDKDKETTAAGKKKK